MPRIFFCFLILCDFLTPCLAQNAIREFENYRAVNWNVDQGLANGTAWCVIKDINGFLWIGTQAGLSRFDGNTFKNYYADKNNHGALTGENIQGLIEDSLHNIWIGTNKGLSRLDIHADSITNFSPLLYMDKSNLSIVPFWSTQDELFCVESDSIITTINIHSFNRKTKAVFPHRIRSNYNISIRNSIYEASSNSVWILPDRKEGGLLNISLSDKPPVYYSWSCFKNISNHNHFAEGMCYDRKRNSIWINSEDGILQFTLTDKQFHQVNNLDYKYSRGSSISIDQQNRIWVGTGREHEFMFVYSPESHTLDFPINGDSVLQQSINSTNSSIYFDRSDMVWVVYWTQAGKGLYQLIPYSESAIRYSASPSISDGNSKSSQMSLSFPYSVINTTDGRLWFSKEDEINILEPKKGIFKIIHRNNLHGLGKNEEITFYGVDQDAHKALLVVNNTKSLFELDIRQLSVRPISIEDISYRLIPFLSVIESSIRPFNGGIIFLGNKPGNKIGVFTFNKENAAIHEIIAPEVGTLKKIEIIDDYLLSILYEGNATHLTYKQVSGQWIRFPNPMDSMEWNHIIHSETDQSWWINTDRQIHHYDIAFNLVRSFSNLDGMPEDGYIDGLIEDAHGNIWFNTHRYIHTLNRVTGKITTLSDKDGYFSQPYYPGSPIIRDVRGELYIWGGYDGVDRIIPGKLTSSYPPALVYLKSMSVNQRILQTQTSINKLEELTLPYSQNSINLETGIIDYYTKGESRIRYKLEGTKGDWQYGPVNSSIRLDDLRPGTHKLVMQASNALNDFNGIEKTLLIHIKPPWWITWWAYLLYTISLIALIWGIIWYRSRNLKEQNMLLEGKVMLRTKELNQSLEDLKTTQVQLIQSEKMASLGELTAGIAHEIQNPLNFVNNFSAINTELVDELQLETDKGNLEEIKVIANDIKENELKINHHGQRASSIVKGMLEHSRTSTGVKELTDINALADEYLRLSYHGLRAKDPQDSSNKIFTSEYKTNFDETLSKIKVIPQDIGRVFLNLINNAFYAVNEKSKLNIIDYKPCVTVATKMMDRKVEISITDNGSGIPDQIKDKIFQPFFTTKPSGQGTGLGLSLAYDIITKGHLGKLEVVSEVGKGSSFIIQIPTNL